MANSADHSTDEAAPTAHDDTPTGDAASGGAKVNVNSDAPTKVPRDPANPDTTGDSGRSEAGSMPNAVTQQSHDREHHIGDHEATLPQPGMSIALPQPGEERLASQGLYTRGEEIGRGGMGRVSLAWDHNLQRQVAVKEMVPTHRADADAAERFLREAYISGGLEHPGTVPVHQFGVGADGLPFYTMKYISGETLGEAIADLHDLPKRDIPFRRYQLLQRFMQACQAVAFAHTRGVIHRDIKPGNIMLGEFGETVLLDWGIAKVLDQDVDMPTPCAPADPATGEAPAVWRESAREADDTPGPRQGQETSTPGRRRLTSSSTEAGEIIGTPGYMSPEQARGDIPAVGPAADVFSLGATLYALVTGQSPYSDQRADTIIQAAATASFTPPRRVAPDVPRELETIILRAMAKRPADRYGTACELAADLERFLTGGLVEAHAYTLFQRLRNSYRNHRIAVLTTLLLFIATNAFGLVLSGASLAGSMSLTMLWIADAQEQKGLMLLEEWLRPADGALRLTAEAVQRAGPDEARARSELQSIAASLPSVQLLYFSWSEEGTVVANVGSDPTRGEFPEDVRVQDRPWYQGALRADGAMSVSEPYADVLTGMLCVSVSRHVVMEDRPEVELIVAADLNLEPVAEFLRPTNFPEGGAVLVTAVDPTLPPRERWANAKPVVLTSTLSPDVFDADAPDAAARLVRAVAAGHLAEQVIKIDVADAAEARSELVSLFDVDGNQRMRPDVKFTIDQAAFVTLSGKPHMVFTAPLPDLPWEVSTVLPLKTLTMPFARARDAYLGAVSWGLVLILAGGIVYGMVQWRRRPSGLGQYPTPSTPGRYRT